MIADNLAFLRRAKGFSLEEVAQRIGVSRQAVAKWESGETLPDLNNSLALSRLYGVTLDDLVSFDQEKEGVAIPPKGKHIFGAVTVGDRGQIVIPKKARDLFGIAPGDSLMVLGDEQQGIAIVKSQVFLEIAAQIMAMGKEKTRE